MNTIPKYKEIICDFEHKLQTRRNFERKQLVNLALKKGATKAECAKALALDPAIITRLTKSDEERKEGEV